jgi:hypothetical protein
LIFTWRFSTQLHHAKHKMAIDYGYIHFFQHLPAQRKQQVLQESSLELFFFIFLIRFQM